MVNCNLEIMVISISLGSVFLKNASLLHIGGLVATRVATTVKVKLDKEIHVTGDFDPDDLISKM